METTWETVSRMARSYNELHDMYVAAVIERDALAAAHRALVKDYEDAGVLRADRDRLAAELARLRATFPDDAAGLLRRGMIAMGMVADQHSEIYGDEHEMTIAMRQDRGTLQSWAARLEVAGKEE